MGWDFIVIRNNQAHKVLVPCSCAVLLPNDAEGNESYEGGVVAVETVGMHPFGSVVTDSVTGETRYHAK